MKDNGELGFDAVCCLLHNLDPGGSARQWIHLLGRHVQRGGRATIIAPDGPLEELALAAGIGVVPFAWDDLTPVGSEPLWPIIATHDIAIVHWDHRVMRMFGPALRACGRAALVVQQAPHGLLRWFGPEILPEIEAPLDAAVADRRAVLLVRGEGHRRRMISAFGLPERHLRILPASIPLPPVSFLPAADEPREVLALTRLSPEKSAIVELAVELVRARLRSGHSCRLSVSGDGPWRPEATALCERRLPRGSWQMEGAPQDPIARLAAADLIVAQGLTTIEAASLERRVVVARALERGRPAGSVLTPERYDAAARDPFGQPVLKEDANDLWEELLGVGGEDLRILRGLVERHNSLEVSSRALGRALAATTRRRRPWRAVRT